VYNSETLYFMVKSTSPGWRKKSRSYSGEHTPSFTELCKPHAIESLIVTATPQECMLSDLFISRDHWLEDGGVYGNSKQRWKRQPEQKRNSS